MFKNHRCASLTMLLVLTGVAWGQAETRDCDRPNLLLIVVDDLRWDELGCTGHPFVSTPRIDRLAQRGVLFSNAFCSTPLCSPNRATILTGLYAHAHGIVDNTNRSESSHRMATFPQDLQRSGYETAFLGKWHMGNDPTPRPGFDYWVGIPGQGETFDPEFYEGGRLHRVAGYITDLLTDRAVEFIRRARQKPFFLYLAHKAIHPNVVQRDDGSVDASIGEAFLPAERHRTLYAHAAIDRRPSAGVAPASSTALSRPLAGVPPLGSHTGTPDEAIRNRLRMLAAVDESTGRLVDALNTAGVLENTAVVFTSDNGYFNGEHGLSIERRLAYEESIRIPLVISYPALTKSGGKIEAFARSVDLAPTLLDLAGAQTARVMHGRSLVPLLYGHQTQWPQTALVEYFSDTVMPRIRSMGYRCLRTSRYKLVRYTELAGMDEFYDLESDPFELENQIFDPAQQDTIERMQRELAQLLNQTGDPAPQKAAR